MSIAEEIKGKEEKRKNEGRKRMKMGEEEKAKQGKNKKRTMARRETREGK